MGSQSMDPLALFPTKCHLQGCSSLTFLLHGITGLEVPSTPKSLGWRLEGLVVPLAGASMGPGAGMWPHCLSLYHCSRACSQRSAKKTRRRAQKLCSCSPVLGKPGERGAECSREAARTNAGQGLGLAKHIQLILPKLTKPASHCPSSRRGEVKGQRETIPYIRET